MSLGVRHHALPHGQLHAVADGVPGVRRSRDAARGEGGGASAEGGLRRRIEP